MSIINILSPHVADLIAAGEVVERPASVIKELVENSFDAQARNVTVEIRNGGATYIRVSDDGCGMAPDDACVAFERHATSKLHDAQGLESISTMGFRGEALAAIASVSRIELLTRQKSSASGTRVTLDAGEIQDALSAGCPEGTTMIVRDLFYNTPARLKFMKSDRSEAAACIAAAMRCALGRPDVSVRFIRDGNEEFFSPGDGKTDSCLYSLLGREDAAAMLPIVSSGENISLTGYISSPSAGRGNRAKQFFFVNGRAIKSVLLQSALEQAYRNTLLTGKFPACVLYIKLSFGSVDVNVHPAKTEIRFDSEKTVFDFLYQAVKLSLENENRIPSPVSDSAGPGSDFYKKMTSEQFRASSAGRPGSPEKRSGASFQTYGKAASPVSEGFSARSPRAEYWSQTKLDIGSSNYGHYSQIVKKDSVLAPSEEAVEKNVENSVQNVESLAQPNHKTLGEAFKTYILVEQNGELLLIDKHAAHERMVFDRLKASGRQISSQMLITPVIINVSPEDAEIIENSSFLLSELGFDISQYGESEYIIRGIPTDLDIAQTRASIEEIIEAFRSGKSPDPDSARDEILHTIACKAAIKAGWDTGREELEILVDEVLSGRIKYCPHGRPVSAVISRRDLDRLFKRIV